ncbi:MAG TPA: sensor histidine kinase [Propionibacteriaceae bacterium]|nr:sensor histidine kinase [Propionibacteriaceae bacterium]
MTPGKEESDRDAMTAAKLGRVGVPEATGIAAAAQSVAVARSRSPSLALRLGIAGVAVASAVVGWVLFGDTNPALWTQGYWAVRELLPAAIAFSIGGAVLLRYRKARWPAGALLICGLLAGLALLFAGLWWDAMMVAGALAQPLFLANGIATDLLLGLSLTVLPQLYPDGPLPGRLWKVLLGVSAGLVMIATLMNVYDFPTVNNLYQWYFWSTVVGLGWLIALASLIVRWRRGNALLRRQIVGFATVSVIMIAVLFLSTAYGPFPFLQPTLIVALWPLAVVIAIAVAVLQYHLYDVRLVIRRVVVYGGLTIALTALFVGVYFAVLAALSGQVVAGRYRWVAVAIATVAVLAAEPVRRRIQSRLERRFLGERGDPLRVLARLHATLSNGDEDENTVYATITRTVAHAVRSPSVALALHRGPQIETVSATGAEQDAALVLPLVYRGERLGEMRVGPRTPGEPYGRVDRALLDQLANETSALVYALRRDTELQSTRRRALETVAEERARLGRDLHDGIAPLLAGAGLTAEALRKGMTPGTADEQDAERLASRLRNAATEIRRLAHDLQPAPVEDRGLEAALADYIATLDAPEMPKIRLHAEVTRPLPTAVEHGAYLVVLEALNNVARHAHAGRCDVTLTLDSGELVLLVTDDGVGLSQPYVSGIGITSMRSRVQALGGVFALGAAADGGTWVRARIPVEP